jgi:hypothetical protein
MDKTNIDNVLYLEKENGITKLISWNSLVFY